MIQKQREQLEEHQQVLRLYLLELDQKFQVLFLWKLVIQELQVP